MGWGNPLALWLAALALPIVVFYILKIRMRRVPVSTVLFWRQVFDETQPRSIWQKLRHLVSLLVQLALLALLVLALSEPFFTWERNERRRLVLILDNSASMNATDEAPTRLAAAKERALGLVDALRFQDEMAIVSAGTQAKVLCGLTGHQRTLKRAVEDAPATDGPTRVPEAIALARRLLAGETSGRIVVLSDGGFADPEKLAQAADIEWVTVGKKTNNLALTRFQSRRALVDPLGYEVLAEVANLGDEPVEARLELDLDGAVVDVVPIQLEPNGRWSKVFRKTATKGGILAATLRHEDALAADNRAWAVLPERKRQKVLLVSSGAASHYLTKVFEASPLVDLTVVKEPSASAQYPPGTVIVFHRQVPQTLPLNPVLVIEPTASSDLWDLGEQLQNPIVTKEDNQSPLLAHVRLTNVLMPQAAKLTLKGNASILVGSLSGDPLYARLARGGEDGAGSEAIGALGAGDVLILTVNLEQGDLPLRTAFPILVTNALAHFGGTKGELRESLAAGSLAEVEIGALPPAGEGSVLVKDPEGAARPAPVENKAGAAAGAGNKVTVGPLDAVGIWTVVVGNETRKGEDNSAPAPPAPAEAAPPAPPAPPGPPIGMFACNLADERESDLRVEQDQAGLAAPVTAGVWGRPLWFYLLALAWCLVGLEWYLYQRRWIS